MTVSKRLVVRSGFGIIIGLLLISTFMGYRVQQSFSERSVEIHRRFVAEQEMLTSLRRTLYLSAVALRDHFINPRPDKHEFRARLAAFEADAAAMLERLEQSTTRKETLRALHSQFEELWAVVRRAAESDWNAAGKFEFVQQEVVPRRDAAGRLLREIERANNVSLADSELEFRQMRTAATERLLVVLGACLLCGAAVAWFSTRHLEHLEKEAARRFSEVSEAKRELERLSARLMEVQEEERMRLSRELHDEIVQNLAVLKMDIAQAQTAVAAHDPRSAEMLSRARTLAESTVQTVRNISLLLRPSLLDDLGLVPALQWQTEEFTRRTGIPCEFSESIPEEEEFGESVKTCVYRVTQEALRNCEKHAGATRVSVAVDRAGENLVVRIEDNGIGFPPAGCHSPTQLGLLGMRERATALGGTVTLTNLPQGGACVRLTVPAARRPAPAMEAHA